MNLLHQTSSGGCGGQESAFNQPPWVIVRLAPVREPLLYAFPLRALWKDDGHVGPAQAACFSEFSLSLSSNKWPMCTMQGHSRFAIFMLWHKASWRRVSESGGGIRHRVRNSDCLASEFGLKHLLIQTDIISLLLLSCLLVTLRPQKETDVVPVDIIAILFKCLL